MIGDIDALLTSIMPNLKTAYFDYNKISSIPDFSTSKSMIKELVFRNNRIVQIAPTAFKSFKEMSRLDLSNNNIRHLNETAFSANSRLESLILNWNRLTTVTGVFNRTPQIRHLRLSFNQIRNITAAFNGLTKLRSLSIRNNLLTCIPDDTFRDNRGLQKVTLNENDIQWIGRDAFQGLDKLKIITLRNNRLLTLNNSMRNLPKLQYIDASFNAIQGLETGEFARNINLAAILLAGNNISSVKGAFVAATYLRMLKIDGNRLLLISRGDFAPKMRSKPSLIINSLLVIILTLLAIYLRYGRAAKLWARTLGVCGWTPCTEEQDLYLEKLFDVFVSFSSKDTSWVNDELLPRLDILGLSYCTYERNFKGGFLLQDIIRDAIACSRRTLLLLTRNIKYANRELIHGNLCCRNFVESEWCRWEFRLAHQRALDDNINRLVIVLVDEEAAGALDGDLRLYVRAANHLRWGEPNFWERLQRSLPNNGAHKKVITEEPLSTRMTGTGGTELSKITAKKLQYQYSQDNISEKEVVVG
ncbi:hypothetical protein V5799_016631 [Amblyomma americanum]|uniref:TIR domain-containing protein n=1 Tax=Amblyomma americanum TaxID=6943 RepID=A0AAQ4F5T9_AMBAM